MSDGDGVPRQPSPTPPEPVPVGTRGGGVFLGVMLVVLGAVFLVSQFLPWFDVPVWALWPLIIVVAGVVQVFTPGSNGWGVDRVFEGLGTVIFGLVLLGNTTGYISWSVWWVVVTLWPALVIALGLSILAKGLGQSWLRIVATLVVWLTLAYAVAVSWTGSTHRSADRVADDRGRPGVLVLRAGRRGREGRPPAERRSRRDPDRQRKPTGDRRRILAVRAAELLGEAARRLGPGEDRLAGVREQRGGRPGCGGRAHRHEAVRQRAVGHLARDGGIVPGRRPVRRSRARHGAEDRRECRHRSGSATCPTANASPRWW